MNEQEQWQADWQARVELHSREVARESEYLRKMRDYSREEYRDAVWSALSEGLATLALRRPSGDDSVYDYWPNALAFLQLAYSVYVEEIQGSEIDEYLLSHAYETLGAFSSVVIRLEAAFNVSGAVLVCSWADRTDDYIARGWPAEQIVVREG